MYKRFHGIDLHKRYATISIRNEQGEEINTISRCEQFREYVNSLNSEDIAVVEAVNNAFYWADEIEKTGASCVIIDPYKFKIISESWSKTDKRDAKSLSLSLWVSTTRKEFSLPTIYKPSHFIRELRRLFSQYELMNAQIVQYKNIIQAQLSENGITLPNITKERLLNPRFGLDVFETLEITHTTRICIIMNLYLLWNLFDQKEILKREIYKAGIPLKKQVRILISIKGVSPLLALAFLADVGDITRFKNSRQLSAYLGVAPRVKSSGGKTHIGSINRHSRNLSRTLFTQSLIHFISISPQINELYESIKVRRGAGRSRIALLRRVFGIMRRMLLENEEFRYKDEIMHKNKCIDFEIELIRLENMAQAS